LTVDGVLLSMLDSRTLWLLLPRPVRRLPADLAAVVVIVALTCLGALVPGLRETPLRLVAGVPFLLVAPGYALSAALFPERAPTDDRDRTVPRPGDGITGVERAMLSVGVSLVVVPLVGTGLTVTPWGIRLVPILVGVSGVTLAATALAARRRWALPSGRRFAIPYDRWLATARSDAADPGTRTEALASVALALGLLLAAGSVTYAVAAPDPGPTYTEFYLLSENETGALVAGGYPTEFEPGQSRPLVVGVDNHEGESVTYSVVVLLQRVAVEEDTVQVVEQRRVARFDQFVEAGDTWRNRHAVEPPLRGSRLRLTYLLYRSDPPGDPSRQTAYRSAHLWINVTRQSNATDLPAR
jgi:uncharacterized membrane protein